MCIIEELWVDVNISWGINVLVEGKEGSNVALIMTLFILVANTLLGYILVLATSLDVSKEESVITEDDILGSGDSRMEPKSKCIKQEISLQG